MGEKDSSHSIDDLKKCQACGGNLVSFGLGQTCEDCKTRWYNGHAIPNSTLWSRDEVVRLRFMRYLVRSRRLGQDDLCPDDVVTRARDLPELVDAGRH